MPIKDAQVQLAETVTFDESLQNFIRYLHERERSEATIKGYSYDLGHFARWFGQTNGRQLTLQTLTPVDVREYRSYMRNIEGSKPATVNRHLRALRAFCRWTVEMGLITADPTVGIKEIKQQRLGLKALDRAEIYRVIQALEECRRWALSTRGSLSKRARRATRDLAMVTLLLHTGLRVSELVSLRLSDVEMSDRKGSLAVVGRRNNRREVPLNADARKALRQWLKVRPDVESEALFLGRGGLPLGTRGVQAVLAGLGRRVSVERLHPHLLRHTFATQYLEANPGDLVGLAAILGRESLETLYIYAVPDSAKLSDKVERLAMSDE